MMPKGRCQMSSIGECPPELDPTPNLVQDKMCPDDELDSVCCLIKTVYKVYEFNGIL